MTKIELVTVQPGDSTALNAAIACYWKANMELSGKALNPRFSDTEVIAQMKLRIDPRLIDGFSQQFERCVAEGHIITAVDATGKTIGIAGYMVVSSDNLNIKDGRSETVALINYFKLLEHHDDVSTAQRLLTATLDLVSQRSVTRIVYGKMPGESPESLSIDNLFGRQKFGFEAHTTAPLLKPPGYLMIAGINGAYNALGIQKIGKFRQPELKL